MIRKVVLVTHAQLSEEARRVLAERDARVVYLSPPISEDMLIETIAREAIGGSRPTSPR